MKRFMLAIVCLTTVALSQVLAQGDVGIVTASPVYKTITIDGDMNDWAGIQPAVRDETGDGGFQYDFEAAYLANDRDHFYIRVTFSEPQPYGSFFWYMNIGFDTNLDSTTGHRWLTDFGSEFIIQGTSIFDQRCGDWVCIIDEPGDANGWGTFANAEVAPLNDQNVKDIEISIRRDLVYKDMENGQPGLSNPDETPLFDPELNEFIVVFETEDESFTSAEWMPDPDPDTNQTGVSYIFADAPAEVPAWEIH